MAFPAFVCICFNKDYKKNLKYIEMFIVFFITGVCRFYSQIVNKNGKKDQLERSFVSQDVCSLLHLPLFTTQT